MTPQHPGAVLREELRQCGLTQAAFAAELGRPTQAVNEIINGKKSITAMTALGIEAVLGIEAQFWLYLQADYDLEVARTRLGTASVDPSLRRRSKPQRLVGWAGHPHWLVDG